MSRKIYPETSIHFRNLQKHPYKIPNRWNGSHPFLGSRDQWTGSHSKDGEFDRGKFRRRHPDQGHAGVGETGKVTCQNLRANTVIVAGLVPGEYRRRKLEIRSTGRVWGDVQVVHFPLKRCFLPPRPGDMEEQIGLGLGNTRSMSQPMTALKVEQPLCRSVSPTKKLAVQTLAKILIIT